MQVSGFGLGGSRVRARENIAMLCFLRRVASGRGAAADAGKGRAWQRVAGGLEGGLDGSRVRMCGPCVKAKKGLKAEGTPGGDSLAALVCAKRDARVLLLCVLWQGRPNSRAMARNSEGCRAGADAAAAASH